MHLLVIEDERALCETIVRSLRRLAYSVDCCYDGEKALELLGVERYDLVLLDLNLPGKDGMVHISKLAKGRVEKCEDVVKIGDELEVKVAEIDSQGRINLVRNDIEYDNAEMPRRSAPGQRPPRRDANRR